MISCKWGSGWDEGKPGSFDWIGLEYGDERRQEIDLKACVYIINMGSNDSVRVSEIWDDSRDISD